MKMRPPATPIINIDPYFSIWTETSFLNNTVHWTGKPNTMCGRVFVDGVEYIFLDRIIFQQQFPIWKLKIL